MSRKRPLAKRALCPLCAPFVPPLRTQTELHEREFSCIIKSLKQARPPHLYDRLKTRSHRVEASCTFNFSKKGYPCTQKHLAYNPFYSFC
jgi:hypothetical protein